MGKMGGRRHAAVRLPSVELPGPPLISAGEGVQDGADGEDVTIQPDLEESRKKYQGREKLPKKQLPRSELEAEKVKQTQTEAFGECSNCKKQEREVSRLRRRAELRERQLQETEATVGAQCEELQELEGQVDRLDRLLDQRGDELEALREQLHEENQERLAYEAAWWEAEQEAEAKDERDGYYDYDPDPYGRREERAEWHSYSEQFSSSGTDLDPELEATRSELERVKAELESSKKAMVCGPRWFFSTDAITVSSGWLPFPYEAVDALERGYEAFLASPAQRSISLASGSYTYEIDFGGLSQTNVQTNKVRKIKREVHAAIPAAELHAQAQRASEDLAAEKQRSAGLEDELRRLRAQEQSAREQLKEVSEVYEAQARTLAEKTSALDKALATSDTHARNLAEKTSALDKALATSDTHARNLAEKTSALDKALTANRGLDQALKGNAKTLAEVVQRRDALIRDLSSMTEARTQAQQSEAEAKLALARQTDVLNQMLTIVEDWKTGAPIMLSRSVPSDWQALQVQAVLRRSAHADLFHGARSRCHGCSRLIITKVVRLHNKALWHNYQDYKTTMRNTHKHMGVSPGRRPEKFAALRDLLPEAQLDDDVNEVLGLHGCSAENGLNIAREGFDNRVAGSSGGSMYGRGIYLTTEICKAMQYCGSTTVFTAIVARVAPGDFTTLKGPVYQGAQDVNRPMLKRGSSNERFDSHLVDPSVTRHSDGSMQAHTEIVLFDRQAAYPEYLIEYTVG